MLERLITSEKAYLILVNSEELYEKALDLGYAEIGLVGGEGLTPDELEQLAALKRFIVLYFDAPEEDTQMKQVSHQLYKAGIDHTEFNLATRLDNSWWAEPVPASEKMDSPKEMEAWLAEEGYIASTDYKNRCGNCHKGLGPKDKYCRYCGTERGKGEFKPYYNQVLFVYGPPIKCTRKCSKCGHRWTSSALGGDKQYYCPRCGSKEIIITKQKYSDLYGGMDEFFSDSDDPEA